MMNYRAYAFWVAIILSGLCGQSPAVAAGATAREWFSEQGYVEPDGGRVIVCHGYGCTRRQAVNIDGTVIQRAATLLKSARSAEAEREALSEIVREYTAQLARELGGAPDRPGSPLQMAGQYGQMDCLDETANTTSLLVELGHAGFTGAPPRRAPGIAGIFLRRSLPTLHRGDCREAKPASNGRSIPGGTHQGKGRISCRYRNGGRILRAN